MLSLYDMKMYGGLRPTMREESSTNGNLSYNPATGANYLFSDISRRPFPDWGTVNFEWLAGWSNYYGTDFSFTKRYSDNWQLTTSYTLAYFKDAYPRRDQWFIGADGLATHAPIPFPLAPDMGGEWALSSSDQRHRFVFNGIWEVGGGFQVSGLYFYGSGQRLETSCGGDRLNTGSPPQHLVPRLCADGTVVPRNSFVGDPVHRVDARFQQRIPLFRNARIDGILEMFNLFNRANYGSYETDRAHRRYGQPNASTDLAYAPRTVQLGFRMIF